MSKLVKTKALPETMFYGSIKDLMGWGNILVSVQFIY